jgi:hypothetical protein
MKARFNQVPLYVTLSLMSGLMGGCSLLGGDNSGDVAVQPSPQPNASQPFPSPSVPATLNSPSKIALTRPTNPDDRLRVIKSGRNDPFGLLVAPQPSGGTASNSSSNSENSDSTSASNSNGKTSGSGKSPRNVVSSPGNILKPGAFGKPTGSALGKGTFTLPALPAKPEMASVKVTGVIQVAGSPRAIIQAPNEPTSRTVSIGDSLANGQLYVKNIDMSNSAEPVVIFQQGDLEFAVAVGRDPVLMASADPGGKPVRGLYSVQARP